jgi:low temperature requirement protein LtrA
MPSVSAFVQPMLKRDSSEENRSSTSLELFFDLVFVVTVSATAQQWHQAIGEGRTGTGMLRFVQVMFAVWWAWMGFTWFANFFDVDDVPYRLLVLLQLLGSLALAAGVAPVFQDGVFRILTGAYVVIRIAMGAQWLRAAHANPGMARYCHRWALGIWTVQIAWIVLGFGRPPSDLAVPLFFVLAVAEMAVPVWASVLPPDQTADPHPEHAEERYGLFTLIILGEMVLVASDAFNNALGGRHQHLAALIAGAVVAAVLAFAAWWLYFGFLGSYDLRDIRTSFIWGYGHYFIFGALTAVGASLAALLDEIAVGERVLPQWGMALTLALPVAVFLATIALLRRVSDATACNRWLAAAAAVLVIGVAVGSFGALAALVAVALVTAAFLALEIVTVGGAQLPTRAAE